MLWRARRSSGKLWGSVDPRRIYRLYNHVQTYDWGSTSAIQELLGVGPSSQPWAELWMGAHPSAPSRVLTPAGWLALDAWIARDPEGVLGDAVARRFGARLPFLLKVLAAASPLSIQAHPDLAQARAGFARENAAGLPLNAPTRCYRDANHKPELICALTPFRALNRFREPDEIAEGIAALAGPEFDPLLASLRSSPDRGGIAAFLERWLGLAPEARERLMAPIASRAVAGQGDPALAELCRLSGEYPGDPGVLAPLFLNWIELAPGEAMFLPPGELHSYLLGTGIELMASSDNVLRGGLTSKHVDVPELLATLNFASGPVERLRPHAHDAVESRYPAVAEEFSLCVLRLGAGDVWRSSRRRGVEILLCTEGRVELSGPRGAPLTLVRGGGVIVPDAAGIYRATGTGVVYRASVGFPTPDR